MPRASHLTILLLLAPSCAPGPSPDERPPDVLLVSLDTLRADRLGCYGHDRDTSPTLDALAAGGVLFREAHAPSGNTKPSHMSLFTGLDPLAHDVRPVRLRATNRPALNEDVPTLPELLREAGYQTASFTDRGGLPPTAGFARGFQFERAEWEELPRKIAAVGSWLETAHPELPLFLFFHTYEPHAPYLPPGSHRGKYADPSYTGEFRRRYRDLAGTPMAEFWREKGRFLEEWEGMGEDDVRFLSDLYDEEVAWTDHNFQRLLRTWGRHRSLADTVVVVLSDHGEAFHEHGLLGHQRSLYAELVRVPLILSGPGLPRGVVVEEPVSLTGVLPTLLELLGLASPETQVESFLPLVRGERGTSRPVYSQMGNRGVELFESVTLDGLRLLRTTRGDEVKLELFDWTVDPDERRDLADERPDDVDRLRALLDVRFEAAERLRERFPPGVEAARSPEEEREIEALGYGGGEELDESAGDDQ